MRHKRLPHGSQARVKGMCRGILISETSPHALKDLARLVCGRSRLLYARMDSGSVSSIRGIGCRYPLASVLADEVLKENIRRLVRQCASRRKGDPAPAESTPRRWNSVTGGDPAPPLRPVVRASISCEVDRVLLGESLSHNSTQACRDALTSQPRNLERRPFVSPASNAHSILESHTASVVLLAPRETCSWAGR